MVRVKDIRLKQNDYKYGWYFITVVTDYRKNLLANIKSLIESNLIDLNNINGCELDYYIIMPNHVHLILDLNGSILDLGEIIRRFKAKTSKIFGQKLWQPNYYEHGIRNEEALNRIREYIINNPEAELLKFEQFYK